jgi:hypothetical protein
VDSDITDAVLGSDCHGAAFLSGVLGLVWALEESSKRWLEGEVEASPLVEEAIHRVLKLKRQERRPSLQLAHDKFVEALRDQKRKDPRFLSHLILWMPYNRASVTPYPPQPAEFFSQGEFKDLTAEKKVLVSDLHLSPDTQVLHATHFPDFISMIKASGSGLKIEANRSRRGQYAHTPLCWFGVDLKSGNTEAFEGKTGTHTCRPNLHSFYAC